MSEEAGLFDTRPLIDFSSPVAQRKIHSLLSTPLIPVPTTNNKFSLSPTNTNPFDVVARQTITPDDPFECAFKNACTNLNESEQSSIRSEDSSLRNESVDSKNKTGDLDLSLSPIRAAGTTVTNPSKADQNINESVLISYGDSQPLPVKIPSKTPDKTDESQLSAEFSTEEGLKAVIARRVNKCIQKVLNNSVSSKSDKNNEKEIKSADSLKKNFNNRRSLSFITSSNNTREKHQRLNKSCTDSDIESFLENEKLNVVDTLIDIDTSDAKPLRNPSDEITNMEDSVFESNENKHEKDQVFAEANKLALTFQRISESFTKNPGHIDVLSDDEEDNLLTCKPQWLDSSEDEEEKLRKDPALNIRVSFTSTASRIPADSPALAAFKNRQKSLGQIPPIKMQDEPQLKRCVSIGSKLVPPVIPNTVPPAPLGLVKVEEQLIKLKKKTTNDIKKGPLKAVIPIQIMTKEQQTPPEVSGKPVRPSIREPSPIRKQNIIQVQDTPTKDKNRAGMLPVASSTPNKFVPGKPQLLVPIDVPSNKRRSLGSTIENRKSRPVGQEDGSRQRSNSANCSNPTLVASVKPFKAQPLLKPALKPKSTSSLTHTPSPKSQVNAQRGLVLDKASNGVKETKLSSKSRVLSDVKPHSPRLARVKTTMTAISSLVTGKGKKSSIRGKENRVPA